MKKQNGVHHFADGGYGFGGFDLGDFDTLTAVDNLGGFGGGNFDLGSFDDILTADALGSGAFDLGSFEDLALADLVKNIDLGPSMDDMSYIGVQSLADILEGERQLDIENLMNLGGGAGVVDLSGPVFSRAADSQAYNETLALEDALAGYRDYSLTPSGMMIDGEYYYMPSSTFNAAKDSQLANEMIERGDRGFEQFGRDALAGYREPGATPSGVVINGKQFGTPSAGSPRIAAPGSQSGTNRLTPITPGEKITETLREVINRVTGGGGAGGRGQQGNLLGTLLPLLLMMMAMRDKQGGGTSNAVIPALSATQRQTPYTQIQQAPGYRPGQGGITYFNPVQYAPRMAAGGIADLARGRLLDGKGDGVSDDIPAVIGTDQPARLARGEYVIDARTVAELGNGSTDAGAERLDEMRKRVHAKRRKAKVGQDSKAYKELPA